MSYLLDAVREGRALRDAAQDAFATAVARAKEQHSFTEVAQAAGMTRAGVQHVLRRHREESGE